MPKLGEQICKHVACERTGKYQCENCDTWFCSDHGTVGGDREGGTNPSGSPYGAYAVPSVCWKCDGQSVDE